MPRNLVTESETPAGREARPQRTGKSASERYVAPLRRLHPDAEMTIVVLADETLQRFKSAWLRDVDVACLTVSSLHVFEDSPKLAQPLGLMQIVIAPGTWLFGSRAVLQLAVVAAGGTVLKMPARFEVDIARQVTATEAGREYPLLAARPPAPDAPAVHGDEVENLPADAALLASNGVTRVKAANVRHNGGTFWNVHYHRDLASAVSRRQAASQVQAGLAENKTGVDLRSEQLDALLRQSQRRSSLWALGVDCKFAGRGVSAYWDCEFPISAAR